MPLRVLPSGKLAGLIGRGSEDRNLQTSLSLSADVQEIVRRPISWGAGVEVTARKRQRSVLLRESRELRSRWSVTAVGEGVADCAVGSDVDLLATGHFDILGRLVLEMSEREG